MTAASTGAQGVGPPAVAAPAAIAIVGAGPAAASLLERLSASAAELLGDRPLQVHLIDPHRAGTGRVWRPDNHPGLWMNSLAEDVTMFTDDSVTCDGPVVPGPSLYEWSRTVEDGELARAGADEALVAEIRSLTGTTFPTRRVQSTYLAWFFERVLSSLPPTVEVVVHPVAAVDVTDRATGAREAAGPLPGDDPAPRQVVHLADGATVVADAVVLALGHVDAAPDDRGAGFARFAAEHGLAYVGPGHTAELDFSAIGPGAEVIALGFGQAFTDLVVLLTEGRGGRFVTAADGTVGYEPSGREPVLHVGSRRGVPYRSKLDYRLQGPPPPLPRFLDEPAVAALLGGEGPLEFRRDVLPLVLREVGFAYYHELFHAHPERTRTTWGVFHAEYAAAADEAALARVVAAAVPDPADVFDVDRLDRPLAGLRFGSGAALHHHVRDHVQADVARRTDPAYSADLAAFVALLQTFGTIARIAGSDRLTTRSRVEDVGEWWFSFFMYYASGPPPARLRQLLALERAGLVRFLGADTTVRVDPAAPAFVATSSSHPDAVRAGALVEALIAKPSLGRATDPLLRHLRDRGEIVEETVADGDWHANTGKVVVAGPGHHLVRADGTPHPARHGLGAYTSRPAAGAFSRPRTNAPSFRVHDTVARTILAGIAGRVGPVRPAGREGAAASSGERARTPIH